MIAIFEALEADEAPEVLPLSQAITQALATWHGEITTHANGRRLRHPVLPNVEISTLEDGTPVMGAFDTDDTLFLIDVTWGGFSILSCGETVNLTSGERDYGDLSLTQLQALAALVNSGVIAQVLDAAEVWTQGA